MAEEVRNHTFELRQHGWNGKRIFPLYVSAYRCFKYMDAVWEVSVAFPLNGEFPQKISIVEVYKEIFHIAGSEIPRMKFLGDLVDE